MMRRAGQTVSTEQLDAQIPVRVTKEMLGNTTRKSLLYLDQSFLSLSFRESRAPWVDEAIGQITELLDLQLLAVPYSSTHIAEADLFKRRDELVSFIQQFARGHLFEPYYSIEETQIARSFEAFLAGRPPEYAKQESDAISREVHNWDDLYSVSAFTPESGFDRKRVCKQRSVDDLLGALDGWQTTSRTFEEDMELEFRDSAGIFRKAYIEMTERLYAGDFSVLTNGPIAASVVENLADIAASLKVDVNSILTFFSSAHFRATPMQQLSARIYSAFKERLRKRADQLPTSKEARAEKYSGLIFDVQHAATYAPYCDAFFADNAMANIMKDKRVAVEKEWGCKVFSSSNRGQFSKWLGDLKASMTPQHLKDLAWAYPRYRKHLRAKCNHVRQK